ncbi:MAG: hypothetical protein ACK4RV_11840 [Caulobacter sp.]
MTEPVRAVLMEVDVLSPDGEPGVLRFSDRAVRPFPPTDPLRPNIGFDDRLNYPPALRRAFFDDLASLSPGLGFGAAILANADGGLDPWEAFTWGEMRIWLWTDGTPFSAALPVTRGLTSPPEFSRPSRSPAQVRVSLYDYRAELERPLQETRYAGDNDGEDVLYEGTADDLKNRPKPLAFGRLEDAHIPAPMVNAGVLAHQLHDGEIAGQVEVFDRGDDAGFVDEGALVGAAFDAFEPDPASHCQDLGRGLVKINGDPVGRLTFGLLGDAAGGYAETTGPVLARMLGRAGVPADRIGPSVSGLAAPAVIGAWFGDQVSGRDALGWVARSAMAVLAPDRAGVWAADRLAPPAAIAVHTISADELVDVEPDATTPAPAGEVRVGYGRIWTVFRGTEIAPALRGSPEEARLTEEYRWAVAEDATVKARFPRTWRTIEVTTALRGEADALALASDLKALFGLRPDGRPRRVWRLVIELTAAVLAVPLGATIAVESDALDGLYLLIAEEPMRPRRDLCIWTVWG